MRFFEVGKRLHHFNHFYPAVPVVIGVEARGRINFMPAVWNVGLSFDPPLFGVGVSPKRFTYGLLEEAGAFSVTFHPFEQAELVQRLGSVSGREVDKVAAFGLEVVRGRALDVPLLGGFYAAYELEKTDALVTGDHTLFVGRVRGLWEDPDAFAGETLDPTRVRALLYYGRYRYGHPAPEVRELGAK